MKWPDLSCAVMNSRSPRSPHGAHPRGLPRTFDAGAAIGPLAARGRRAVVVVQQAAMLAVLLLSPSTYAAHRTRRRFAVRIYRSTTRGLVTFLLLSTGLSGVLVQLIASTMRAYGLAPLALEGIVRVLLLELLPLLAAVFVLVEVTLPAAALLSLRRAGSGRQGGRLQTLQENGPDALRWAALPRALAGMLAPLALCMVASWIALALAYLTLYGATPWALQGFAHVLGGVFEPVVAVVWLLKTIGLGVASSLLPIAAAITPPHGQWVDPIDLTLTTLVRSGALLLLIELVSLLAVYA